MAPFHFTVRLSQRRDLLLARQRARQAAGLLGLPLVDQVRLAAAVFELASSAYDAAPAMLQFGITDRSLYVRAVGSASALALAPLHQALPPECRLPVEDVAWAMQKLFELAPFRAFEEVEQQNRDLRLLLREMTSPSVRGEAA